MVLLLALAPIASADWLTPESGGSPNANDIDTLYKIVLAIGAVIFVLVEGLLIFSIVKFRRRRGGPEPALVHGNTPLEVGWTIGAAAVVAVIAAITFIYLPKIKNPPNSGSTGLQQLAGDQLASLTEPKPPNGKALHINVVGQQYIWRFDYVDEKPLDLGRPVYSYMKMVVPTNTTVVLRIHYTWFKISKPGVYRGQCAELCGNNHADMLAQVHAVSPDKFSAWLSAQRREILQSQTALAAQRKAGEGQ